MNRRMSTARLTIDLTAIAENWRRLNALTQCDTAAVVKANGYGLGAAEVAGTLAKTGVNRFFVATAQEGAEMRAALGAGVLIAVFAGHRDGDTEVIAAHGLTPMLNSAEQLLRHLESLPGHSFGIQLDTGMNRLGMEDAEWAALRDIALSQAPKMIISHLACADDPDHPMNARQLRQFTGMTAGTGVPRSLAATGGILLGPEYHFEFTRPGVGLYGGHPFEDAAPVVSLDLPVIQIRDVTEGETVGYGNTWTAGRATRVATLAAGYADGLIRAMGPNAQVYSGDTPAPLIGRVSMDLITVDVTDLPGDPDSLSLICSHQGVDDLATAAGTIGYEILTALGARYDRVYLS